MKRIITLILLPILFFTMVGQAIPQQGTSNLLRPLATYESPFSNGNLGDRFRRAWPGNEGFEKFLELNPQIRGLHETIPRIFHDLRSRVVPAWEITLNNPVVISNANNQDRAGRTFTLFTMTHKGLNAGRVLVVRDVRGFVEAIGVENTRPGFNTEGMNYFAQIAREDPLWQAIQGKAPRELSSDVSVDRENFVYLPWLMSEDEAEDLRDLVAGDALLTHLFQSDKMPFADINSRGVIMLASTGRWDGFKDDESGVIMRSVAVAHNDISTLAHEMGHFFLDEVARDPKEAKKIEKYVNSGRRDKTFLRNLIAGHYLAPGPYASEHRKEIVCQETLLPLFEAFLDRTGVAVVDKAYTYLETGDVEVFCDLGLLPDWARPGFVGEIVPPEYFALLQVRAEERGLEIFEVNAGKLEMTERIARSLYAIAPGVDSFLRKRDIHDNVPVMRQIHREIRDNPMVLGQVTVHQFLWDVLYRYWDIGDTASIKAFLRIMKTLNYKFDDYMDEAMRPQGTAQEVKQDSGATLVPKVRMRSRTAGGAMDKYLDPPFGAGDGINFKLNLKKVLSAADQKWIADKIANVLRSLLKGFPAARVLIDGLLPAPEAGYITFGPAASESILSQI